MSQRDYNRQVAKRQRIRKGRAYWTAFCSLIIYYFTLLSQRSS